MKIYNYKTKKKEPLKTIKEKEFKIYVCGITPYDSPHIGHVLVALRFNIIRNYLSHKGFKGIFVQNITDIDDKIINKAKAEGVSHIDISARYIAEYEEALLAFNIKKPDYSPKVTEYIDKIIVYIENLINKNFAYVTNKGNVYFDVSKKADYGKLSNKKLNELQNKESSEDSDKKNSLDFALWKAEEEDGFFWSSPWGRGRPGWHIECSVMSNDILGESIDMHGGGLDLVFPHHENELAQCEAHNNKAYVKYWMYSGLLNVDGVKMSKSLGNFITAKDALEKYGAELFAYVVNTFHYRSNINFQDRLFVDNLNNLANFHKQFILVENFYNINIKLEEFGSKEVKENINEYFVALDEDFNTAKALVSLNKLLLILIDSIDNKASEEKIVYLYKKIKDLGGILNLFLTESSEGTLNKLFVFHSKYSGKPLLSLEKVNIEIEKMKNALGKKDYPTSDAVRGSLLDKGIKLMQNREKDIEWRFVFVEK